MLLDKEGIDWVASGGADQRGRQRWADRSLEGPVAARIFLIARTAKGSGAEEIAARIFYQSGWGYAYARTWVEGGQG
jgi:hypothetical protein